MDVPPRSFCRRLSVLALVAALVSGVGCRTTRVIDAPLHPPSPPGAWHVVKEGETWASLAARTGVPLEDLLEINGLRAADTLVPGQVVYLLEPTPGAPAPPESAGAGPGPVASGAPGSASAPRPGTAAPASRPPGPAPAAPRPTGSAGSAPLRWPLSAPRVSSLYGTRDGRIHEGIDLAAPIGTPIYAAREGFVLYAGDGVRGYGNMIVLQHAGDLLTVYAHNSVLLVRTGDRVAGGQEIARVGMSGRASAPHLHFEVRQGEVPRDPMQYLPGLPSASR
jgi:murein DD-endopeptidase MepM/ murein hydrolase activator NlpD